MLLNKKINIIDTSIFLFLLSLFFFNGTVIFYIATFIMSAFLFIRLIQKKKMRVTGYGCIIIIFIVFNVLFIGLGLPVSVNRSLNRIMILSLNFIIFLMLANYLSVERHRLNFMRIYLFASLVFSLFLIIADWSNLFNARLGINLFYPLGFDIRYNPNLIGFLFNISIMFMLIIINKNQNKKLYLFIIYFIGIIILLGSRKSIILTLGLLTLPYFLSSISLTRKLKLGVFSSILVAVLYLLITQVPVFYNIMGIRIEEFIVGFFSEGNYIDSSSFHRSKMISLGFELIRSKPFFGHGIDSYTLLSSYGVYAHNNYIELWVGVGIVGLLIYYLSYFWLLINLKLVRTNSNEKYFYMTYIILLIILDFAIVSYVSRETIFPLFIALSIIINSKQIERVEKHEKQRNKLHLFSESLN